MVNEVNESPWKNFTPDEEIPVKKVQKTKLRFSDEAFLLDFESELHDIITPEQSSKVYDLAINEEIPAGYVRQEFEGEDDFIELKFEELLAIYFPRPSIDEFKKKFSFLN